MSALNNQYKGYRFPSEIIQHDVWLYYSLPGQLVAFGMPKTATAVDVQGVYTLY